MLEATANCFRKALRFSGRSDTYEFWGFAFAIFIAFILAAILNHLVFGPQSSEFVKVSVENGTKVNIQTGTKTAYGAGPFSVAVGLIVLVPLASAAWRRIQDTGRPGWLLVIPAVLSAVPFGLMQLMPVQELQLPPDVLAAAPQLPDVVEIPEPNVGLIVAAGAASLCAIVLTLFWFTRGSDGPNKFGEPVAEEAA